MKQKYRLLNIYKIIKKILEEVKYEYLEGGFKETEVEDNRLLSSNENCNDYCDEDSTLKK